MFYRMIYNETCKSKTLDGTGSEGRSALMHQTFTFVWVFLVFLTI